MFPDSFQSGRQILPRPEALKQKQFHHIYDVSKIADHAGYLNKKCVSAHKKTAYLLYKISGLLSFDSVAFKCAALLLPRSLI